MTMYVGRYLLSRLVQGVVVMFGAITISFALTNMIGKPADVIGGPFMTPEQRAQLNASLGYDQPLLPRYLSYLGGVLTGDFGSSFRTSDSALAEVLRALPYTLLLALSAVVVASVLAVFLAVYSATHRSGIADRVIRRAVAVTQGVPEFWLALVLILIFSVHLRAVSSFGYSGPSSLILPVATLSLTIVPSLFRIARGELLDNLQQPYVDAMRARGLSTRVVMYRHVLRNILGPTITFLALLLGSLVGGAFMVETVFSWPGIGNLMVSSVQARDFAVVQAVIVVVAGCYVLANVAADILVIVLDPRIRTGGIR